MTRIVACCLCLLGSCGEPAPQAPLDPPLVAGALPDASLYNLHPALVDQHAQGASLDVHRGHPTVVSMFYTSCPNACPMLIADIRALESGLPAEQRADLRVLLISLDPTRDTPEALAEVVTRHGLDDVRWSLVRSEPAAVREIAAALGIRYRPLADGEMNHSSLLTLVDRDGVPVERLEGLQRDPRPLRDALARMAAR